MRLPSLLFIFLALCPACDNAQQPSGQRLHEPLPAAVESAPPAAPSAGTIEQKPAGPVSGKPLFDYPEVATTAKRAEHVLAPPRASIDEALEQGAQTVAFIYYDAEMLEPGKKESLILTRPGAEERIPNALLISIRPGERVAPGDIVLTSWASGTGLQRAIVVEGGKPDSPRVRYLDLDYAHPSGWGQKEDSLPPDSFHKLVRPGETGSTLACREGQHRTQWIITHRAGTKLLGLGFAGKLRVLDSSDCQEVPLAVRPKTGDRVFVPMVGTFTEVGVVKVDAKIGRVFVQYRYGDDEHEAAFGFTNVATELEPVVAEQK
jgi:hypothetical protein